MDILDIDGKQDKQIKTRNSTARNIYNSSSVWFAVSESYLKFKRFRHIHIWNINTTNESFESKSEVYMPLLIYIYLHIFICSCERDQ